MTRDGEGRRWDEAVAHAGDLRRQGVNVEIDDDQKWIEISNDGQWHDHPDGTPAYQEFRRDGTPKAIIHYHNDQPHDPADGAPAVQEFYPDGSLAWSSHWTSGSLVSAESFPLSTGVA